MANRVILSTPANQPIPASGADARLDAHEKGLFGIWTIIGAFFVALVGLFWTLHTDVIDIQKQITEVYKLQRDTTAEKDQKIISLYEETLKRTKKK